MRECERKRECIDILLLLLFALIIAYGQIPHDFHSQDKNNFRGFLRLPYRKVKGRLGWLMVGVPISFSTSCYLEAKHREGIFWHWY